MTQREAAALLDMVLAIERIESFTVGLRFTEFEADEMVQSAVLYQFNILGEAVMRLSDAFKQDHADIPWRNVRTMRNLIVHVYDGVNLKVVWDVIQHELTNLRAQVEPLLPRP